ncbi:MAG: Ig-like domain-containing protein, partial [Flavobacteriaceae bacterium]|nr:Ig-like domain-containing protein [Flavobacteriaceae bacterium]
AGSTVTVGVSANDSDGTVTKHQVFVNNVLVDTDGINFTPHYIPNISEGSYAIKVTVTDNAGATASTTVNITVGSGGSTPPPPPPPPSDGNNAPTVSITSPNDGQNFNTGSTVKVDVSADDTDGSVTKYQIYVNNTLVDTDGSNFTPHYISNIANGNYVIRATVTDDKGATASATVNISVGSDNPPPPPPPPPSDSDISLTLVNASTDFNIGPLTNGTNVSSGSNINVRADVANSNVKSVYFKLSGATSRNQTENVSPYALFGDISGNYASGTFNGGSHTLTVEAYSGLNRSGTLLETLVVSFTVASDGKTVIAYPNPVKEGDVTIKLPEEINGDAGYAIISPSGTEVERGIINTNSLIDGKTLQIDSSTMKNDGVYYLVIQANYDVFTVPIIKQ